MHAQIFPSLVVDNLGTSHIVWSDGRDANEDFKIYFTSVPAPAPDETAPVTEDDYDGLWHTSDFTITLTATDDASGVDETYYKINDGATMTLSGSGQPQITFESAINSLEYWSVDAAGNEEDHTVVNDIKLDKTAPTTVVSLSGTLGSNNWYTSDVTVTLITTDTTSGVAAVEISCFDATGTLLWRYVTENPMTSFTIASEGICQIQYCSTDGAGNQEAIKSETIKIDKTPPIIIINQPISGNYYDFETITIDFTATDATSGINTVTATLDSTPVSNGQTIDPYTLSLGTHTFTVTTTDNAGNTATETVTTTIRSSDPKDPTQELIETIETWELPKGAKTSLTAKLKDTLRLLERGNEKGEVHKLMDFISEVEALRDSILTNEQADYLVSEAQRIIYLIER